MKHMEISIPCFFMVFMESKRDSMFFYGIYGIKTRFHVFLWNLWNVRFFRGYKQARNIKNISPVKKKSNVDIFVKF